MAWPPQNHGDVTERLSSVKYESDAGITTSNSGTVNRTNFNAWAAANPGVALYIRPGIYDFAGGNLAPTGSILGAGPGRSVLRFPEQSVSNVYVINVNNLILADFEIRSTSTATPDATGINSASSNHLTVDTCTQLKISNVYCNGAANMGIHVRAVSQGLIIGCRVSGTTRDGIHVTNGSTNVSVVSNQITTTGDDCIAIISYNEDLSPNQRISVFGNTVSNIRARGITIEGARECVVVGNSIGPVASHGILINSIGSTTTDTWGTVNLVVSGNSISSAAQDGVHCNGKLDGVTVVGNTIDAPGGAGLRVLAGRVVFRDNTIDDAGSVGMTILKGGGTTAFSVVSGNTIRRPQQNGAYIECDSLTFTNNVVQQPCQDGTNRAGALFFSCSSLQLVANRCDGVSATRNPQGFFVDASTGQAALNYGTNVGTVFGSNASTFTST